MKKRKKLIQYFPKNVISEQLPSDKKIKSSRYLSILFISCSILCLLTILLTWFLHDVHRLRSFIDFYELCRVASLHQYNYRCKFDDIDKIPKLQQLSTSVFSTESNSNHIICLRCLPNVLFIGASKAGTTSMTDYLDQNPYIHFTNRFIHKRDNHREVHRFDRTLFPYSVHQLELLNEYAASPPILVKSTSAIKTSLKSEYNVLNPTVIHYTPHYLYAPSVPFELKYVYPKQVLDKMKFIIMLRNPIERALSSYFFKLSHQFTKSGKNEGSILEFQESILKEIKIRKKYELCMNNRGQTPITMMTNILNNTEISSISSSSGSLKYHIRGGFHRVVNNTTGSYSRSDYNNNNNTNTSDDKLSLLKKCFGSHMFRSPVLGSTRHLDKGIYIDQLERWFQNFPIQYYQNTFVSNKSKTVYVRNKQDNKESINYFIFTLEDFKSNPVYWYNKLLIFLNISINTSSTAEDRYTLLPKQQIVVNNARVNNPYDILNTLSTNTSTSTHVNSINFNHIRLKKPNPRYKNNKNNSYNNFNDLYSNFLDPEFKLMLQKFYEPYNRRLAKLLHKNHLPW